MVHTCDSRHMWAKAPSVMSDCGTTIAVACSGCRAPPSSLGHLCGDTVRTHRHAAAPAAHTRIHRTLTTPLCHNWPAMWCDLAVHKCFTSGLTPAANLVLQTLPSPFKIKNQNQSSPERDTVKTRVLLPHTTHQQGTAGTALKGAALSDTAGPHTRALHQLTPLIRYHVVELQQAPNLNSGNHPSVSEHSCTLCCAAPLHQLTCTK